MIANFTDVQRMAFDQLPSLQRLSDTSSIFTDDQKFQFMTLLAIGALNFAGGLYSCCLSSNPYKSTLRSFTISMMGAISLYACYTLLGSSFNVPCPSCPTSP